MNLPDEAIVELTLAGRAIKFTGDPKDAYFQSLATFHAVAPQLENYLSTHLRPDAVCLDIGANIGLTAVLLALHSPEGRTFAFEASPKNARYLQRNLELNGITTCVVIEAAVGDRPGTVSFRETEFCAGSHVAPSALREPSVISVPMLTIDGFAEEQELEAEGIDFIKLDVEGFEPAVLAGAARTLEQNRCPILMEFNSWCLLTLQNFNPLAFASAVFDTFHVQRIDEQGAIIPSGDGSVGGFLYENLARNGCVDDILLQLKAGKSIPSLDEMIRYGQDLQNARELCKLRTERNASWSARWSNSLLRTAMSAFGPRQEAKHP